MGLASTPTVKVEDIFHSMSYNGEQPEDFSGILNWLSLRENTVKWIVSEDQEIVGEWNRAEFLVGNSQAWVQVGGAKELKEVLNSVKDQDSISSTSSSSEEIHSRLDKLRKLVESLRIDLCRAESVATEIPSWQIQEFDAPTWTHTISAAKESPSKALLSNGASKKLALFHLSRQSFNLQKFLSVVLIPAVQSENEEKLVLALSAHSSRDASCALPVAFLVQAVNKAQILKNPFDLLILDHTNAETREVLKGDWSGWEIGVLGKVEPFESFLPLHLVSGVFSGTKAEGGVAFVVDSSADLQSAVESISSLTWSSGTQSNLRARSLLFVHQPVYELALDKLMKQIILLRVTDNPALKLTDFITRSQVAIEGEAVTKLGAKVFSGNGSGTKGDFSNPTLVYDIGSSTDLVTTPVPGSGHVLVVLPFRSVNELLSLANNFDVDKSVFIYASNHDFLKRTTTSIKGREVRVNSSSRSTNALSSGNYAIIAKNSREPETAAKGISLEPKLVKIVEGAEKSLKSWSSSSISSRLTLVEKIVHEMWKSKKGSEVVNDLIKVGGRVHPKVGQFIGSEPLTLVREEPVGIVGILLVQSATASSRSLEFQMQAQLLPLLVSALKGNVTVVMSVQEENPFVVEIEKAVASLPLGVVSFLKFPTIFHALHSTAQISRFNLLWVIDIDPVDEGHVDLNLSNIPLEAYNKVIIDTIKDSSESNRQLFLERAEYLENYQVIRL